VLYSVCCIKVQTDWSQPLVERAQISEGSQFAITECHHAPVPASGHIDGVTVSIGIGGDSLWCIAGLVADESSKVCQSISLRLGQNAGW
jgi:hypothetical protein